MPRPLTIHTTRERAEAALVELNRAWIGDEQGRLTSAFTADVDQALHVRQPVTFESTPDRPGVNGHAFLTGEDAGDETDGGGR